MDPRCEGPGTVSDIGLTQLSTTPSRSPRAQHHPRLQDRRLVDSRDLYRASTSPTRGWSRRFRKSFLSKDKEALQPHIRAFVDRAVTFTACTECAGTRLSEAARPSKIKGTNIADACAIQISDLAEWARGVDEPSVAPLLGSLHQTLDWFVEIGLAPSCSTGHRARCGAARRSAQDDPSPRLLAHQRHLRLRRAHHEPAPHDIERMNDLLLRLRDKGNTVLIVEHEPDDRDRRPRRRPRPRRRHCGRHRLLRGHRRGAAGGSTLTDRHLDDRAALTETVRTRTGTLEICGATARKPARRRRRHPARDACRHHRRGRLRQELARARVPGEALRGRRRNCGVDRPGRDPWLGTEQPGDVHRAARPRSARRSQRPTA